MASPHDDLEPAGYAELLTDLKARVRATQFRAARAANTEVLRLYWSIGHDILERQRTAGWGAKVVTRLAADLQREFPEQRGWSPSNLKNMRRVAEVWPTLEEFGQRPVGRLPWGHVITLLERLTTRDERDWYAAEAAENGWTRPVLEIHAPTVTNAPVAVADLQGLPDEARGALPSVAELQAVVADELEQRS